MSTGCTHRQGHQCTFLMGEQQTSICPRSVKINFLLFVEDKFINGVGKVGVLKCEIRKKYAIRTKLSNYFELLSDYRALYFYNNKKTNLSYFPSCYLGTLLLFICTHHLLLFQNELHYVVFSDFSPSNIAI